MLLRRRGGGGGGGWSKGSGGAGPPRLLSISLATCKGRVHASLNMHYMHDYICM